MTNVYTSGTFDLFHYGHLNVLLKAKTIGDHLTVGVSTDELVESYKGINPIMGYEDRVAILKQIKCVDRVIEQSTFFDIKQLGGIDIIVLGTDWENKPFPELENALEKLNIKMKYIPYTERLSTSAIKMHILNKSEEILHNLGARRK